MDCYYYYYPPWFPRHRHPKFWKQLRHACRMARTARHQCCPGAKTQLETTCCGGVCPNVGISDHLGTPKKQQKPKNTWKTTVFFSIHDLNADISMTFHTCFPFLKGRHVKMCVFDVKTWDISLDSCQTYWGSLQEMRSQFFGRDDDSDSNVGSGSGFFPNKFSTKWSQKTSDQITIEHPPSCPSLSINKFSKS